MKTFINTISNLPRSFVSPLTRLTLPLFFTLAFLPSILHLMSLNVPVTNPLAALGPIAAGVWLVVSLAENRVGLAVLGPLIPTLLWAVNWMMLAGHSCCSTMN